MYKYLTLILLAFNGIQCDMDFDSVTAQVFPLGDPNYKIIDQLKIYSNYCSGAIKNLATKKNVEDSKVFLHTILKGDKDIIDRIIDICLGLVDNIPSFTLCKTLKKSNLENVNKLLIELDKLDASLKGVRDQFATVLTEASKPDTKTTAKDFICLTTQYIDKTLELIPEKDGIRAFTRSLLDDIIKTFLIVMESLKGKGSKTCQLPVAAAQPSKYKSIIVPLAIAASKILLK